MLDLANICRVDDVLDVVENDKTMRSTEQHEEIEDETTPSGENDGLPPSQRDAPFDCVEWVFDLPELVEINLFFRTDMPWDHCTEYTKCRPERLPDIKHHSWTHTTPVEEQMVGFAFYCNIQAVMKVDKQASWRKMLICDGTRASTAAWVVYTNPEKRELLIILKAPEWPMDKTLGALMDGSKEMIETGSLTEHGLVSESNDQSKTEPEAFT